MPCAASRIRLPHERSPVRHSVRAVHPAVQDTVYIGRENAQWSLPQSQWCNPFRESEFPDCVGKFEVYLKQNSKLLAMLPSLAGRRLLCWCKDSAKCHGDVIVAEFVARHCVVPCPVRKLARPPQLLFSGRSGRQDSLASCLHALGATTDERDLENGCDLADDLIWASVTADILAGKYQAMMAAPPCSTFSSARARPLRGCEGASRYGLSGLSAKDQTSVRLGTLLASRAAHAARLCSECHGGSGIP